MQPITTPFLAVRELGQRLLGRPSDYDALIDMASGCAYVLLGEATRGAADFYRMRAAITRRLMEEHGFDGVAIEGDWLDTWRVNRYVQLDDDIDASASLDAFKRFPTWMWRKPRDARVRYMAACT